MTFGLPAAEASLKHFQLDEMHSRVLELARAEGDVIPCVCSTDSAVDMRDGPEILRHTPDAVDLSRAPLPLVDSHKTDTAPYGVVEQLQIVAGKLRGMVRFGNSERARELLADVQAGVLRSLSIAYRVIDFFYDGDVRVVTKWQPYEVSCVAAPADINAGFFRSAEANMSETAERTRAAEILRTASTLGADESTALAAIESGESLASFRQRSVLDTAAKSPGEIGLSPRELKRYSVFKALRSIYDRDWSWRGAEFERECSRAVAKQVLGYSDTNRFFVPLEVLQRPLGAGAVRAMATTSGLKGSYAVGVETMSFIDIVRARSVAIRMGAQVVGPLQNNVVFPRQTSKATLTWQGVDGTSVSATDQALGELSMAPKTAIVVTDCSEQLLRQTAPAGEQFFMADLAKVQAIDGLDNAVINGTGGAQPIGIKNTQGITSGQDAATATYAKILAFVQASVGVNALGLNPGFVTNTAGAIGLQKVQRFSGTDTPLWTGNSADGLLVGFRAMSSEQLANGNLIFSADWSDVVIGEWGVLELSADRGGTRFNQAQVGIRALWMVDVLLRHPQAFVVSTNLS